ncbi:hypothetical protein RCOM_1274920 [Ricinus communis]|uniref:Uncharacterized protein n=1 Tax=Ricinus communis TaxID=3988 RepID=B9SQG7_RICCO|nr:hypothetical protein RCOM_1274920 [Ricinus communis]
MAEGGFARAGQTDYVECWKVSWKTPYIIRLVLFDSYNRNVCTELMASAQTPCVIILGRLLIGLGIAMVSMTHLFTYHKPHLSELAQWFYDHWRAPRNWRWVPGVAGVPSWSMLGLNSSINQGYKR